MKAVLFYQHGGVDELRLEDLPDPEVGPEEVLIRVRACALNHLDLWARRGLPGRRIPLPHISGSDISGEVVQVGDEVKGFEAGQMVLVSPGISCGRCQACLSGRDNYCRHYQIIGYQVDGGYAELVKVPSANIILMPAKRSFEEAAAFPLTFLTAWHMLVTRAMVKPGDSVLVLAASSGVGSASVQVAKLFGASVIATVGSEDKMEKARKLGVDHVINHRRQDMVEEVMKFTDGEGVDIAVDHVGSATWEKSLRSLAYGGSMVTCGATTGSAGQVDIRYLFGRQLSILGSYMGSKGELLEALKFFEQGKLSPVIDRAMPLHEAAKAQKFMEESRHFGKIVLTP